MPSQVQVSVIVSVAIPVPSVFQAFFSQLPLGSVPENRQPRQRRVYECPNEHTIGGTDVARPQPDGASSDLGRRRRATRPRSWAFADH